MGAAEAAHSASMENHRNKMKLRLLGLNIKTSANIGLWTVSACVDAGTHMGEQCMSMSMDRFAQSLTQSNTAGKTSNNNSLVDKNSFKDIATNHETRTNTLCEIGYILSYTIYLI